MTRGHSPCHKTCEKPSTRIQTYRDYFGTLTNYLADGSVDNAALLLARSVGAYSKILGYFVQLQKEAPFVTSDPRVFDAHTPVTYLSWVQTLRDYNLTPTSAGRATDNREITFYCPVDIEVCDPGGNLVGRIAGDQVDDTLTTSNTVSLMVDEETGAKHV